MDYKKINFKCGVEIHQQLSDRKLFCECSSSMKEEKPNLKIIRKLNISLGETGALDKAAKYESKKNQEFVYQSYENESCLVESDGEPPHKINEDALTTAISVAKALKMNLPDNFEVMRKIILDGSSCSSFQRTMVIGLESDNSYLETPHGKVKVTSLCLEEDSCKIIKKQKNTSYYSLARQGIPLIEIRTAPDIKNPEQAKEVCQKLGTIIRSFKSIKRGLGTIRQDVNLSIQGKARIEIKGFQDLKSIPKILDKEISRLSRLKKITPEVRKANKDLSTTFMRPLPGAARMYPDTDIPSISSSQYSKSLKTIKLLTDKISELKKKYSLDDSLAKEILNKQYDLVNIIKTNKNLNLKTILKVLIEIPKDLKKRNKIILSQQDISKALDYLNQGKISIEAVPEVLIKLSKKEKITLTSSKISKQQIKKEITQLLKKQPTLTNKALMGILMKKYRGRVPGKELMELIKSRV